MMRFNREQLRRALRLYLVTDRAWLDGADLAQQVEAAIQAGVTFLQIREKALDQARFLQETLTLRVVAARHHIPFVVNDDVELAVAADADGVHVGQGDREAALARAAIGPDRILGVSVRTVAQARKAVRDGADYLGVGAVFTTTTKADADAVTVPELAAICGAVSVPVVAIGGIHAGNARLLAGSGIAGIAVVSAILAQPDIRAATRNLVGCLADVVR